MLKIKKLLTIFLVLLTILSTTALYAKETNSKPVEINDATMAYDTLYLATEEHGIIYSSPDMKYGDYLLDYSYQNGETRYLANVDGEPDWHKLNDWIIYNTDNSDLTSNKILKMTSYESDTKYIYFLSENGLGYISGGKIYNIDTSDESIFTDGWTDRVSGFTSAKTFLDMSYLFIAIDNKIYTYYHGGGWKPQWRHHPGSFPESMEINTIYAYDKYDNMGGGLVATLLIGSNLGLIETEDPIMGSTEVHLHTELVRNYQLYITLKYLPRSYSHVSTISRFDGHIYIGTDMGAILFDDKNLYEDVSLVEGISFIVGRHGQSFWGGRHPDQNQFYYSRFGTMLPYKNITTGTKFFLFTLQRGVGLTDELALRVLVRSNRAIGEFFNYKAGEKAPLTIQRDSYLKSLYSHSLTSFQPEFETIAPFDDIPKVIKLLSDNSGLIYMVEEDRVRILETDELR